MRGSPRLRITGVALIDGIADTVAFDRTVEIEDGRIGRIYPAMSPVRERDAAGEEWPTIDGRGKFLIPGLMNANVHLLGDTFVETLARYEGRYENLILEAAQIALRNGFTTVFDTWGPRRFLVAARDRIRAGDAVGARIYCGGNIIGFDGPFSPDFLDKAQEVTSAAFAHRINGTWVENVGRRLMWLTPEEVAAEVRAYIAKGVDFVKYAANDHAPGAFLAFSPRAQAAIVAEAHRANLTAQAHTMTVEGLRGAVEAGCNLIQHVNITGPTPIPDATIELLAESKVGAVVFPFMQKRFERIKATAADRPRTMWQASDTNVRRLIASDACLLLANDGALFAPEVTVDPLMANFWGEAGEDRLLDLETGHIAWFRAMEEKGCDPMRMLKAATINIARAYGVDRDLGSIAPGKIADLLLLDGDPLRSAENYVRIAHVIQNGAVVDRGALPVEPLLTRPPAELGEEDSCYVPFFSSRPRLPGCPACLRG